MGGAISFGALDDKERTWFCAGWCYRALLEEMIRRSQGDDDLLKTLREGVYFQGLTIESIEEESPALARRFLVTLASTAREIVEDDEYALRVNGELLGRDDVRMFQRAVRKLVLLAEQSLG